MPLTKLQFRPGVNREGTDYSNEGGWYDCDKIRFRSGFPEKIGGWGQVSANQFLGICRNLWNWVDSSGNNFIGVGTNVKYYIYTGGSYNDITPVYATSTSATLTTNGTTTVTVTDSTYSPSVGDYFFFGGAYTIGGYIFTGEYVITAINPSTNTYQFVIPTTASSDSGTVTIKYEYPTGSSIYTVGTGWGAGPYGGFYGTGSSQNTGWGSAATFGVGIQLRLWSSDNYGQDLALAPRGGPVYYWQDVNGVGTRAVTLASLSSNPTYVPNNTYQVLTAPIQQFLICLGANSYIPGTPNTPFNPLLVRWSDQADPTNWVPTLTNQSGEFPLSNGSQIIGARSTRQETLVWTDTALYSMQYIGTPYIWGFQILMDNISIMSPNAMITVNNVTYWMGTSKFYIYSGTVQTLPCSVRQYLFGNLNTDQSFQVFAGANEGYNEVWWFYCSKNSTQIDSYVIYNYLDQVWYYGSLGRTAWIQNGIEKYPVAADYNGRLLNHEFGVDDNSTSVTLPIDAYIQSSDFDIGDGHNFGFVWRILPDVNFNGSNVNAPSVTMTVKPRQNSGTPYGAADNPAVTSSNNYGYSSVYNVQQFTGQVYTRLRGRQMAFRIESTGIGVSWQLGSPRIDIRPDGRR
jgi:hypothetical protein